MSILNEQATPRQSRGIRLTVLAIVIFMVVVVAGFVHRIQQPRVMTATEMKVNGFYLLETPRNFGEINLIDQDGKPFVRERLEGRWTLVFFGFTYCPDICPTTMSCSPSVQPSMTPFNGNEIGSPRATELSNIFPSVVQPV